MRIHLPQAIAFVALAGVGALGWVGWWRDHNALKTFEFTRQRLAFVEGENRRLQGIFAAQQGAAGTSTAENGRREIERTVTSLRQLPFLRPVAYREIPRSELASVLRQKLSQQVPDLEFDRTSIALAAFGLVPQGLDLKKTYLGLLGEQVGAFYDQHTRELFTFSGQSLANSQNRVILAHELTHALEDQHFNLERLPLEAKGNDDRSLAASALVEGDATLVMNRYLLGNLSADVVRESLVSTVTTDVRQLAGAPRYLRETLLFPYLKGQAFCQVLYDQGGWDALRSAFENPPSTTSQIMHPERFLAHPREEAEVLDFGKGELFGVPPIADNVLGEFGLRQCLIAWLGDESRATEIATGWRSDHYLVFGDAKNAIYVWKIAWRLPHQAEAFAEAVVSTRTKNSTVPGAHFASTRGTQYHVSVDSARQYTLIISAGDAASFDALKAKFGEHFTEYTSGNTNRQ